MKLSEEQFRAIAAKLGPPRGGGRPQMEIDLEIVQQFREAGYSMSQIGEVFRCSRSTLIRRLNGQ